MDPETAADADQRRAGITLRELEVLQSLVGGGTAINAARRLGISQSAVSRRLAQLEDRLGFQLFMRAGGRLVPTVEALSINEQLTPVFETLARIATRPGGADYVAMARAEDSARRLIFLRVRFVSI